MAQTSLNSTGVASTGALSLQSNGTTEAIGISTGQVATLAQNPVLTSGVANGLAFLNASKVLTTGSALTFDGTNFGVSGNQATAIATTLNNSNATVNAGSILKFNFGATNTGYLWNYYDGADFITALYGSKAVLWNIGSAGGSEQMRLTSTGLGIGTSSFSGYRLNVKAAFTSGLGGAYIEAGEFNQPLMVLNHTNASVTANLLQVQKSGAGVLTLDSSGNLGLGITPSANSLAGSGYRGFNLGTSAGFGLYCGGNEFYALANSYYNSGWKYAVSSTGASQYYQANGEHRWYNAPSGTAGNAISFTQAMTLDASGNWLLGVTATINAAKALVAFSSSNNGLYVQDSTGVSAAQFMRFDSTTNTCGSITRVGTTSAVTYNATSDYRLKTVIGPVADAGQRIDALEPIEYEWKEDGSRTRGFLAHKFQEVYANSVSGEKDAVDANGSPLYQSMQAGSAEVIADLVAEIQSLRKRLAALETK